jgi:ferrous iron transport protein B
MSVHRHPAWAIDYGPILEPEIERIQRVIENHVQLAGAFETRWLAVKLLEGEQDLNARLSDYSGGEAVVRVVQESLAKLSLELPGGVEITIADRRYAFVNKVVADVLTYSRSRASLSERVDRVVTSSWLGFPIFLVVMYLVFNLVVNVSAPYLDWIDATISGPITAWAGESMALLNAPGWIQGLVLNGVIAGVGGVLVFLPGLIALFLFIGILEDSGYMARAAFVMHRFMSRMGLSGRSFVALILGFGCAVPAIYATRTLDSFRERVLTGLLVPLMSCAARLPVYVVFGIAFFSKKADVVVWSLYALGVVVAALSAWLLSHTVLKPEEQDKAFLLELPSYRFPSLRSLWFHISQRTGGFLRNAGTVILAASIVIWLLLSLPQGTEDLRHSWFGEISAAIAPVLTPAGFGNWETSGSLVTGLIAKEVVVSTMSQIYTGTGGQVELITVGLGQGLIDIGSGFITATRDAFLAMAEALTPFISINGTGEQPTMDTELGRALQQAFTPLTALAFLVFVLLYVPCVATLSTIRQEFGTRWAVFSACYQTGIAWIMAVAVFQIGTLLGYA